MSTSQPRPGREPIARAVRPLPGAPNLEYERKNAKALLKQAHAGSAEAVRRVRAIYAPTGRQPRAEDLKLADIHYVLAREYGFASWPRMVEYFETLGRHRKAPRHSSPDDRPEHLEAFARGIVRRHQGGDPLVARELAHFVPRFFARPLAQILATPITEDEARLVVARERRRASWEELMAQARTSRDWREERTWEGAGSPLVRAQAAITNQAVDDLAALLDEHPALLSPTRVDREWRMTLASLALSTERETGSADARRVTELLATRGVDIQRELDERLLGWPHDGMRSEVGIPPATVQWYLDRGANPEWMPPNEFTVLEHALVRYRNPESVDLIAARVTPRRALWIAAGLGHVSEVEAFCAGSGRLTPEGRQHRPDLLAISGSPGYLPPHHDADDLEIMFEAFLIAGWNSRWAAMDALLDAGLPVDHAPLGMPLLALAIGNLMVPLVEYLVSREADLDREWPGVGSARSAARSLVQHVHDPEDKRVRRVLALCSAGTVEELRAALDAQRPAPPVPEARVTRALQLAADDAARQAQSVVTTENMLVGLLRLEGVGFASVFLGTGADMSALRARIGARLLPDGPDLIGQGLPSDAPAATAFEVAQAEAASRRRSTIGPMHLLYGLLSREEGEGVRLLRDVGTDVARLSALLKEGI